MRNELLMLERRWLPLICALAALLAPGTTSATIQVDAGPDLYVVSGVPTPMLASVSGLAPVEYWTADGDNGDLWQAENHIVSWSDVTGLSAIGPLQAADATPYGWPSDLILIGPTVYGIDTFLEQLYSVDPLSGIVTPVGGEAGNPTWDTRLGSLAYDPVSDLIYSLNWRPIENHLAAFDRTTESWSVMWSELPVSDARGLAWSGTESLLYLVDTISGEIHTLDPVDGTTVFVLTPDHYPGPILDGESLDELFYDELQFYDGRLFGALHARMGSVDYIQVNEIDLVTGKEKPRGPTIEETDAHSLLIWSMPEAVQWTMISGPGVVTFDAEDDIQPVASFSADGEYELELMVDAPGAPSDTVVITVPEPGGVTSLGACLVLLAALGWRRRRAQALGPILTGAQISA
jgi:hypothetical protein